MSRLFASLYDRLNASHEAEVMGPRRERLLAAASGTVLEIGTGTGTNLAYYRPEDRHILTEPDRHMRRRLRERPELADLDAEVVDAPAEQLPVADHSVDAVVATLVLCSVEDTATALAEIRRVLRPDGRLLFLEHVRSHEPSVARWQDRLTPVSRRLAQGCHLNRDTVGALRSAGFSPEVIAHPVRGSHERLQPVVEGQATLAAATQGATH